MEKLLEILEELKPGVDYKNESNLVDDGVMDSLTIVELISALEDEYGIEVTMEEFIPENFKSMQSIYDMIQRLS